MRLQYKWSSPVIYTDLYNTDSGYLLTTQMMTYYVTFEICTKGLQWTDVVSAVHIHKVSFISQLLDFDSRIRIPECSSKETLTAYDMFKM